MPTESAGYSHFIEQSKKAIASGNQPSFHADNPDHQIFNYPDDVCYRIDFALKRAIENLDDELFRFEKNFLSNANKIVWAGDYDDVFLFLKRSFKDNAFHSVAIPQNPASLNIKFFQEIGLDHFLSTNKIEISPSEAIRFFYVDTIVSESGSLVLNGMDNEAIRLLNTPGINIFFTTISHIIGAVNNIEVLSEYKKQCLSSGGSSTFISRGNKKAQNFLLVVDNCRTKLLQDKSCRQALTCINCGKCTQVCPVVNVASPQAYDNVFDGPIGNVVLPFLENHETYRHAAYACTMCGRCEEICPLHLPLRDMMLSIRRNIFEQGSNGKEFRNLMKVYRHYLSSRGATGMNAKKLLKTLAFNSFIDNKLHQSRQIPSLEDEPFNKQYQKQR